MSDWLLLLLVAIPLFIGQLMAIGEVVIARRDLAVVRKVIWVAALVLIPMLSLVVYVVTRPQRADGSHHAVAAGGNDRADAAVTAIERQLRGELSDADYDELVRGFTGDS